MFIEWNVVVHSIINYPFRDRLIRSGEVCTRNGGTIVDSKSQLASPLICCLPSLVESNFAINGAASSNEIEYDDESETPTAPANDASSIHELVLKLRKTSFWGAPLVIGLAAAPNAPVALYVESSARQQSSRASTPVTTVAQNADVDSVQSVALNVASPGVYHLTDESSRYQSGE